MVPWRWKKTRPLLPLVRCSPGSGVHFEPVTAQLETMAGGGRDQHVLDVASREVLGGPAVDAEEMMVVAVVAELIVQISSSSRQITSASTSEPCGTRWLQGRAAASRSPSAVKWCIAAARARRGEVDRNPRSSRVSRICSATVALRFVTTMVRPPRAFIDTVYLFGEILIRSSNSVNRYLVNAGQSRLKVFRCQIVIVMKIGNSDCRG